MDAKKIQKIHYLPTAISNHLMKKGLLTLTALVASAFGAHAATIVVPTGSTVIASWSFDSLGTFTAGTNVSAGAADIGSQTSGSNASVVHVASVAPTTPSGNGSPKSFSSSNWAVNDYFQFVVNTTGYSNIELTWGEIGSNTGPANFKLSYSTDGTTFTDFNTYSLTAVTWQTSTFNSTDVFSFDLSSIATLNSIAAVTFRLVDTSTTPISGTGTVGTAGTDRVDDFTVSSGPVTLAAAPEPSTCLTLGGGIGMLLGLQRLRGNRRRSRAI